MKINTGKLIVIDGTDGSGKTTQIKLLQKKIEALGFKVKIADFPQYNTKAGGLVEEYLSGKYGQADEVDAYKTSILYAADRYDASFKIRSWLKAGDIVLSNRYVSANMGHQGGKIDNPLERKIFFNWLYNLEYKIFDIPRPDLSIILHVEAELAQELAHKRQRLDWKGKTKDIHEDKIEHLKHAEQIYLEIANNFPDFKLINCTRNKKILEREEISNLIWSTVSKIILPQTMNSDLRPIVDIIKTKSQFKTETIISPQIDLREKNDDQEEKEEQGLLLVEKLSFQAKLPQKAHPNDAAYDLYANDHYSIVPYGQALISTGIKLKIPKGQVGLIWDKSSLANSGITSMGGVIDSDYRGEIKVIIKNLSEEIFNIVPGQKIAQIIIQKVSQLKIQEKKINDRTERADKGFGSSGKF